MKKLYLIILVLFSFSLYVSAADKNDIVLTNCGYYRYNNSDEIRIMIKDGEIFSTMSKYKTAFKNTKITADTCPSEVYICYNSSSSIMKLDSECPSGYYNSSKEKYTKLTYSGSGELNLRYCGIAEFDSGWTKKLSFYFVESNGSIYARPEESDMIYPVTTGETYMSSGTKFTDCPKELWITDAAFHEGGVKENRVHTYKPFNGVTNNRYVNEGEVTLYSSIPIELSDKYKNIQSCRDATYKYIKQCGCMPASLTDLTSRGYMLIKIAAPALLLIVGGFDLVKAMSAQDDSAIKKTQQKLVKKFVAAAAVFLILTLTQFLVSTLSNNAGQTLECLDYILNGYAA